jgi:TP901 family phage tail tape measure protein
MAAEFDDASAAIVEGTGASGEALDELNEAAQNAFGSLANDSGSIGDVASTLAELNTRFGLTGDAAEDATVKFSNFADHTGTDGVKAVDSIANIMHRWGMDIDDLDPLLDDLTTANQSCQMSVDDLTGYLADNSTQFQELGYSSDEALAMLISLSDGGADVGSVMSGLTKGIANLSGETDDVPGAFQAAVKAISESGSVSEALQQQVGDTGKTVEEVFGKKAAQELATNIQNGSFAIDQWKTALENNDGALQSTTENATTMSDAWSQAVNNVQMALGTTFAPAIQAVVTALANFITPIAQFIQQSPIAQAAIVGIATVLGILGAALAIGAVITAVSAAFTILGGVIAAITSPFLLIPVIIAAIVAALIYAWTHCEQFRNVVTTVFNAVRTVVTTVVSTVANKVSSTWSAIQRVTTTVWNAVRNAISRAITTAKNTVSTVVGTVKSKVSSVWNGIKSTTTSVWNGIRTAISNAITTAKNTVTNIINAIKTTVSSVFEAVKSTVSTTWENIKSTISDAITNAKETVSNMIQAIKGFFNLSDLVSKVQSTFNDIKEKMTKPITDAKEKISGIIDSIKGKFPFSLGHLIKFKLPKVSVTKGEFGVPHFSVSWNARGAVFRRPVIFGSGMYGLQGFGEAGPEVAAPLDTITGILEDAARRGNPEIDYDRLGTSVAKACARMNISIDLDNRTLGRVVRGLA